MELKTSEKWQKLCRVEILDPDGWDRKNYQFSWHEELITRQEFKNRLIQSTVQLDPYTADGLKNIWKDIDTPENKHIT